MFSIHDAELYAPRALRAGAAGFVSKTQPCEDVLVAALRDRGFPATIVRPSHTYDATLLPTMGHWTDIARTFDSHLTCLQAIPYALGVPGDLYGIMAAEMLPVMAHEEVHQ